MQTWIQTFPDYVVDVYRLPLQDKWRNLLTRANWDTISRRLSAFLLKTPNIFPYPVEVFSAFNLLGDLDPTVVIIGQDPYHGTGTIDGATIPQAHGLSFSVHRGIKIPPSLININKNLLKYNHIDEMPEDGNLEHWAKEGCLMLNASLTVNQGDPGSHPNFWSAFTIRVINHISENMNNVVFILWGGFALRLLDEILEKEKHKIIISSHPSPMSATSTLGPNYPSFVNCDCFGQANKYLEQHNIKQIVW